MAAADDTSWIAKLLRDTERRSKLLHRPNGDLDAMEALAATTREQEAQTKARIARLGRAVAAAELEARPLDAMQARLGKLRAALDRATVREAQAQADHELSTRAIDADAYHRREVALLHPVTDFLVGPVVYFVVEDGAAFAKIGWTGQSPAARRDALQTGCARQLFIAALLPGARETESAIHKFFSLERSRGEWFRMSERLAALILEIRHGSDISWFLDRLVSK